MTVSDDGTSQRSGKQRAGKGKEEKNQNKINRRRCGPKGTATLEYGNGPT